MKYIKQIFNQLKTKIIIAATLLFMALFNEYPEMIYFIAQNKYYGLISVFQNFISLVRSTTSLINTGSKKTTYKKQDVECLAEEIENLNKRNKMIEEAATL